VSGGYEPVRARTDEHLVMTRRARLDAELVRRGLASSRREAGELVAAGRVLVGGAPAERSSRLVAPGDPVVVNGPPARFVSRGGEKLDHALETFGIDLAGCRVLDAGASTGGFTDCVLQRGAFEVVALDVGHGQLHERIRRDARVRVLEGCNVRYADLDTIGGAVDLVVADLSFISLSLVVARLCSFLRPGGQLVVLVKPQFELGREAVAPGRGVVTDPRLHAEARVMVIDALEDAGADVIGWVASPITGARGNQEFLVHARVPADGPTGGLGETTSMGLERNRAEGGAA
jgi:23S rRNA (cytidine1920-2'-O)/16S rRNA (cytidine1409-2'-O)-methyltransferase